jgi:hypothetical protein
MPDDHLAEFYSSKYVCGWQQLRDFYESRFRTGAQWIFRGQRESAWGLQSSFEREMASFGIDLGEAPRIERGCLRRFKRQCHLYISNPPEEEDTLEWLALMQHYGAPTRLLDWTYSFFVALYFAIESAGQSECAVWALNTDWMVHPAASILEGDLEAFERWKRDPGIVQRDTFTKLFMGKPPMALVGAVTPRRLNERLVIQQGIFLCPGDVSKTFADNLIALLSKTSRSQAKANFIKITVNADLNTRKDILLSLQRMNMNHATLFPGLVGFAQSLRTLMASPKTFLNPGHEGS